MELNESQKIIKECITHAGDVVKGAKFLLEQQLGHIACHLATFALEEIGKATLIGMQTVPFRQNGSQSTSEKAGDDYVRRLFWALWGPSFGKKRITSGQIKSYNEMKKPKSCE